MQKSRIISFLIFGFSSILYFYSSPAAQELEVVGSYYFTDSESARSIYVEGNYAYLARNGEGLVIFDISDLSMPFIAGIYDTAGFTVHDVVIQNNKAYLAVCGIGMVILDVSNPNSPILLGSSDISHQSHGINVKGDIAYLAHCEYNLTTFNVVDPHNPFLLYTQFYDFNFAWDITVRASVAYLLILNQGLKIFDVSNPSEPYLTSFWTDPECVKRFAIFNNVAYIPTSSNKIRIVDVSNIYNPVLITAFDIPRLLGSDINTQDNMAYITGYGIMIIDISDPSNPVNLAEIEFDIGFHSIFVRGDIIFLAGYHWLYIVRYSPLTGVANSSELPEHPIRLISSPNPFNSSTTINYNLNEPGMVNLSIYNIQGQRVAELLKGIQQVGEHSISWDASHSPSGVYFARLEAGGSSRTAQMVLLK